jgi:hypothetical protein
MGIPFNEILETYARFLLGSAQEVEEARDRYHKWFRAKIENVDNNSRYSWDYHVKLAFKNFVDFVINQLHKEVVHDFETIQLLEKIEELISSNSMDQLSDDGTNEYMRVWIEETYSKIRNLIRKIKSTNSSTLTHDMGL